MKGMNSTVLNLPDIMKRQHLVHKDFAHVKDLNQNSRFSSLPTQSHWLSFLMENGHLKKHIQKMDSLEKGLFLS